MIRERIRTAAGVGLGLGLGLVLAQLAGAPVAAMAATATAGAPRSPLVLFGATGADPVLHRFDGALRSVVAQAAAPGADLARLRLANPALRLRVAVPATQPEILLDAVAQGDARALARSLQQLGLRETAVFANAVGGWLPVSALSQAAGLPELKLARASMPRTRNTGPVALQGDFVQRSAALRSANPTLTGQGILVGVLSDSFDCYSYYAAHGPGAQTADGLYGYATSGFTATYADDQSSGALPSGVQVLKEASCADYGPPQQKPFTDEGRAMLQIVHAVAPAATLAFRTAVSSEADFANGVLQLQQAGAKVILDDIGYPDEPFFQDGMVAQAIDEVSAAGAAYFSAVGNDGRNAWQTTSPAFATDAAAAAGSEAQRLDFGGGTLALPVTIPAIPPGDLVELILQWDQPFVTGAAGSPGAGSQLDLCIDSASAGSPGDQLSNNLDGGTVNGQFEAVSYPACTGPNDVGGDPLRMLIVGNPANAGANTQQQTLNVSIRLVSGAAPGRIKLLIGDNGLGATLPTQFTTRSATLQGHPMASGAVAVGAAFYMETPACGTSPAMLESYSSWGGDPVLFDTAGNRLATAEQRAKPDLIGPDGVNTTHLGFVWSGAAQAAQVASCQSNAAYPNFFGTSAAVPHVAAAAALLWQSQPSATAAQVIAALKSGALAMADGADGDGAGLVQADAALAALPAATSAAAPASHHGGGGALGWQDLAGLVVLLGLGGLRLRGVRPVTSRPWRPRSARWPR